MTRPRPVYATNQWRMHGFRKPLGLSCDFILLVPRKGGKLVVFGANQDGNRRLRSSMK
jgi:hypothetical protein